MIDLAALTIAEARKKLDGKVFSAVDLAKAYLTEIEKKNKELNAYLEVFEEVGEWDLSRTALDENVSHRVANIKIAFVHRPDKVEELAETGNYNFIFYGHTHKPWIKIAPDDCRREYSRRQSSGSVIANPGTLGGVFTFPTFAILDTETGKLELKKLYLV